MFHVRSRPARPDPVAPVGPAPPEALALSVVGPGALLVLTMVCLLAGLAGCGAGRRGGSAAGPFQLGLLAHLTGAGADQGQETLRGAQLAVEMLNSEHPDPRLAGRSGVRGGVLALVVGDLGAGDDTVGRMADPGQVLGVVIADAPDTVMSVAARVRTVGVPLVDAGSVEPATPIGGGRYFRVGPDNSDLVGAVFGLLRAQRAGGLAVRRITVVESAESAADPILPAFREACAAAGNDVSSLRFRNPPGDVSALVQQISGGGTDVVFAVASTAAEAAAAAQLTERLKDKVPVIVIGRGAGMVDAAGVGVGAFRPAGWSAEYASRSPLATVVAAAYHRRFGVAMSQTAATAFTAVYALARAVDLAAGAEVDAVGAALRRTWIPATAMVMPWGGVRFNADGQNELAAGIVEQRTGQGFRTVYPTELSTARPVWPAAKPSARS